MSRPPDEIVKDAMHTQQQLREHADLLESADVHNDMGLSLSLTQAADLLRWAADQLALYASEQAATQALRERIASCQKELRIMRQSTPPSLRRDTWPLLDQLESALDKESSR